jgi:thiosulfate/3-mercaptopyruvate sulfurtransferase
VSEPVLSETGPSETGLSEPVLIEPRELAALLDRDRSVVLADVRWWLGGPAGRPVYEEGHLPGAQYVDLEDELSGAHRADGAGGRHPLPDPEAFAASMRRIGVAEQSLVVAYDADTSLAASRLWWLLTDAGHDRVRVLNGGYAGWVAAGLPTETGPGGRVEPGTFAGEPGRRAQTDGASLARRLASGERPPLVDVRAGERYRGDVEPYDPIAGHIPGALNLPSTENLAAGGRFLSPSELADRFAELDASPLLYCGSGITAAHTLLAMTVGGRTDAAIYPGSWSDWVSDPTRPVATGSD